MELYALEELITVNANKASTKEKYTKDKENIDALINIIQKMDPAVVNVTAGMLLFDSLIAMFVNRSRKENREFKIEDIPECIDSYLEQVWEDMRKLAEMAHIKMFVVNKVKEATANDTMGMRSH